MNNNYKNPYQRPDNNNGSQANNTNRKPINNQYMNRPQQPYPNNVQKPQPRPQNNRAPGQNIQPFYNYNPQRPVPPNNRPIINNNDKTRFIDDPSRVQHQQPGHTNDPIDIRVINRGTNYRVKPAGKSKKKLVKRFFVFILSLILIASILISVAFVGIYSICSKLNYIPDNSEPKENFFELLFTKEEKFNILLIGVDQENGSNPRSDTMMLVTVDNPNKKIKLTSFMRDLWVSIPGHGSGRLNGAFAKGGADLLIKTLKENFKVRIDHYLLIDFEMFVQLIDGIGGIEVEVTEKEASFINKTTKAKVDSGLTELNGEEALIYCRIRKLDSDFMRTQRQRKVISAIIEKVKSQNITTTVKTGIVILPLITTNISPLKLTAKSISLIPIIKYDIEQLRVPVDKHYTEQKINGQQVLVPDVNKNTEKIKNFIS